MTFGRQAQVPYFREKKCEALLERATFYFASFSSKKCKGHPRVKPEDKLLGARVGFGIIAHGTGGKARGHGWASAAIMPREPKASGARTRVGMMREKWDWRIPPAGKVLRRKVA